MSITRRALSASTPATTTAGQGPPSTASTLAPVTVVQLQLCSTEVNGRSVSVFGIRQPHETAGRTTRIGTTFRIRVENQVDMSSPIHWRGLTPLWQQDGVSGISGPPITPGKSTDYDFPLRFGGNFWMHSHEGFQEQLQAAASLIIRNGLDQPGRIFQDTMCVVSPG